MTTTIDTAHAGRPAASGRPQPDGPAAVPICRGTGGHARTIGVVLADRDGYRYQRTTDVERIATVGTVIGGAVAVAGLVAAALRGPRVQRITMGPGGWVSFRGAAAPRARGGRRPWWAVLLRARPVPRSRSSRR
jgi:hypothetical protein